LIDSLPGTPLCLETQGIGAITKVLTNTKYWKYTGRLVTWQ
jgi:hypothetical protein